MTSNPHSNYQIQNRFMEMLTHNLVVGIVSGYVSFKVKGPIYLIETDAGPVVIDTTVKLDEDGDMKHPRLFLTDEGESITYSGPRVTELVRLIQDPESRVLIERACSICEDIFAKDKLKLERMVDKLKAAEEPQNNPVLVINKDLSSVGFVNSADAIPAIHGPDAALLVTIETFEGQTILDAEDITNKNDMGPVQFEPEDEEDGFEGDDDGTEHQPLPLKNVTWPHLCPNCQKAAYTRNELDRLFGTRKQPDASNPTHVIPQSWCRKCRSNTSPPTQS